MNKHHFTSTLMWMGLSVLLLLGIAGCQTGSEQTGETVPVVQVKTAADLSHAGYLASGRIVAEQEVVVTAKVPGRAAAVHVEEGSHVKKGDLLIELDQTDYMLQVQQAEAAVAGAQARLADAKAGARTEDINRLESGLSQAQAAHEVAQKNYDRMKTLFEEDAISEAELEKAKLELEKAQTAVQQAKQQLHLIQSGPTSHSLEALTAEVNRAQSALDLATSTLANTRLTAPIDGIVASRSIDAGEMAQAGVPLLKIVQMDRVAVEASVPQEQVHQLHPGSNLNVVVDGLERILAGEVTFISPVSDPNNTTFPIKAKVENKDGMLRAGMVADLYLSKQEESALTLPSTSVIKQGEVTIVYKLDGDTVRETVVAAREQSDGTWLVTSGLKPSDRIVIQPASTLTDGSKVSVK
ncbi:efflux RND transporter periplasmic adaptor subunit [Brevibacillus humidisoli]|uniref:efflux RND transporter periplasmic adaptor subunit n=1 Tax=Brevibacillus humidisoli TaxID=2895522 RepID=UPI001E654C21|nr:efflux RND transporter periplasmic adaptor subunit [Brevibacillus humidisoli]UFJ39002.1 efflux RND transporter periplasmic adaptor subunit [Brevibacillus humidisoli]